MCKRQFVKIKKIKKIWSLSSRFGSIEKSTKFYHLFLHLVLWQGSFFKDLPIFLVSSLNRSHVIFSFLLLRLPCRFQTSACPATRELKLALKTLNSLLTSRFTISTNQLGTNPQNTLLLKDRIMKEGTEWKFLITQKSIDFFLLLPLQMQVF